LTPTHPAHAHEVRPVYAELAARPDGAIALTVKLPARDGVALDVALVLPDDCRDVEPPSMRRAADAHVERRLVRCDAPLEGRELSFAGLERTTTDALVRFARPGGAGAHLVVRPEHARFVVPEAGGSVFVEHMRLGVEHIGTGWDHLLFVACLLVIAWRARGAGGLREKLASVAMAITGFTVAHSVTLALAVLDLARLPAASVETTIALSIVVAAREVAAGGDAARASVRRVWLVACGFGLLHGFGFAGALRELGLPRDALAEALFAFNVGVELGQLAFVGVVLLLGTLTVRFARLDARRLGLVVAYVAGSAGAYWALARVLEMLGR
jgi:hypothetical protein